MGNSRGAVLTSAASGEAPGRGSLPQQQLGQSPSKAPGFAVASSSEMPRSAGARCGWIQSNLTGLT